MVAPCIGFSIAAWIAAPVLIACVIGVWFFFKQLPFTLLPTGDSGTIRGFFIVQEGASPEQQRQLQTQLDPILQANPAVDKYFTVAGRSGLGAGVFTVLFLKDKKERADIETVAAATTEGVQQHSRRSADAESAAGVADQYRCRRQPVRSLFLCHQWH